LQILNCIWSLQFKICHKLKVNNYMKYNVKSVQQPERDKQIHKNNYEMMNSHAA